MPVLTVTESNSLPSTQDAGTVSNGASGFNVIGVAIAGSSSQNVGTPTGLRGIYGTLFLNADGSFTYHLDNNDPDTNALGSGMDALESFTFTYTVGGSVYTGRTELKIIGVDEPGQAITSTAATIYVRDGDVISALQRIESTAEYAVLLNNDWNVPASVTNNGTILVNSSGFESIGFGVYNFGRTGFVNNGLISAVGHANSAMGANVAGAGSILTNNGVIRAFADRPADPNRGQYAGSATGGGGSQVFNNGLIEVTSMYGEAWGLDASSWLVNTGVIRVTAPGLPRYSDGSVSPFALVGIRGSGTGAYIDNRGTIDVVATTANGQRVGIYLFPDNTNPYQTGTIINSGRIIADTAILATEGYNVALTVTNRGYIEGDLQRGTGGLDVVTNSAGAEWIGNLNLGIGADLVLNAGRVQGTINLNAGNDFFDGRGGTVTGTVLGGSGNDILIGGSGTDRLAGGDGSDVIIGAGGADQLTGGAGVDVFAYRLASDSTSEARDSIVDFQTGVDRLDLSALSPTGITFTTAAGETIVSGLSASGAFSIAVAGSVVAGDLILSRVTATSGDDTLLGDDTGVDVNGLDGADVVAGGAGRDRLSGGPGADTMFGGLGDDIYFVDDGNDRLLEADGGGYDIVYTSVDYSLQAWVEDGVLLGSDSIGILGNGQANRLEGNGSSNVLRGGAGDDVLTGGLGDDILEGGRGSDRFIYYSTGDSTSPNPDHIIAFEPGIDVIYLGRVSPVSIQLESRTYNWSSYLYVSVISDWTVATIGTASGSTMTIWINGAVTLADFRTNAPPASAGALSDFNGDGRSDLLLRSGHGEISVWRGQPNGSLVAANQVSANAVDLSWKVVGLGDFNGDGRDDVLWRHSSGEIGEWLGQTGVFTNNSGVAANAVDNSWSVVRIADYNGDGRDDILWRHSSGEIGQWLAQPNGSFANNGGAAANLVDPSWSVVASGDFNGDGRADILWRHASGVYAEWQGSATGKLNNVGGVMSGATGSVVGSGDFNGDGCDDILMRNASTGALTMSLGQSNGQFIALTPSQQLSDLNWKIVAIGDYNGDGRDDLIWRNSSGEGVEWLGTVSGDFANNGAIPTVPADWTIQSPDIFLV